MLPRENRISRKDFPFVFKAGRVYHSPCFTLRIASSSDEEHHFSFVVSKKVAQKAVSRNLIRRRCYAAVQTLFPTLKLPVAGIFYVKKGIVGMRYQDLKQEIISILFKSGATVNN